MEILFELLILLFYWIIDGIFLQIWNSFYCALTSSFESHRYILVIRPAQISEFDFTRDGNARKENLGDAPAFSLEGKRVKITN